MTTPIEFRKKFIAVMGFDPYSVLNIKNGYEILNGLLAATTISAEDITSAFENNNAIAIYEKAKKETQKKELQSMLQEVSILFFNDIDYSLNNNKQKTL